MISAAAAYASPANTSDTAPRSRITRFTLVPSGMNAHVASARDRLKKSLEAQEKGAEK